MIQKFIPLGAGYADFYELLTLGKEMKDRVKSYLILQTKINGEDKASLAIIMNPTVEGNFQPIYICKEGISLGENKESKRLKLFKDLAENQNKKIIELTVQPSSQFGDDDLYFQNLIGILRTNHLIAPLTLRF
jgi:hypothetical protein